MKNAATVLRNALALDLRARAKLAKELIATFAEDLAQILVQRSHGASRPVFCAFPQRKLTFVGSHFVQV